MGEEAEVEEGEEEAALIGKEGSIRRWLKPVAQANCKRECANTMDLSICYNGHAISISLGPVLLFSTSPGENVLLVAWTSAFLSILSSVKVTNGSVEGSKIS